MEREEAEPGWAAGEGDAAASAARPRPRPPAPERLVRLALVFYAALFALALAWRRLGQGESLLLAAPDAEIHWLRDGALGLAAGAALVAGSAWLTRRVPAGERLARALAEAIGPLRPGQAWVLALASGIGEEALFRGALQPVVGLWLATLLFALAHFVPRRDLLLWSAFSGVAGLLLGGLYAATGNLVAPIVTHVLVNRVNLMRLVREYGPGAPGATQ